MSVTGLGVFSSLLFSSQIVSSNNDYGPIGVLMILLSWLIGIGVCLHLGAVVGRAWNERSAPPAPSPHDGVGHGGFRGRPPRVTRSRSGW